jgi:hypothetical protein
MPVFDLDRLNEGTWFDYPDGGEVCIRAWTQTLIADLIEKHTKVILKFKQLRKHGPKELVTWEEKDEKGFRDDINDFVIVDWKGFTYPDGSLIDCNRENKLKLMNNDPVFYQFVDTKVDILTPALAEDIEDSEKNLLNTQSG